MKSLKQILVDISTKNQPQENWMLGLITPLYHETHIAVCAPHPPPPLPKSMVLRRFGLKTGIDFLHFSLESGMLFEGTTGVYERICRFNSKWIRRNASKMRIRNGFQEIFFRVDVLILGMMA